MYESPEVTDYFSKLLHSDKTNNNNVDVEDCSKKLSNSDVHDLCIFYSNMRSAEAELNNINMQARAVDAHIVVLTETWFSEDRKKLMEDYELMVNQDRLNTKGGHSGGAAIYVHRDIVGHFKLLPIKTTITKGIQDVQICAIQGAGKRIFAIYRSPNISPIEDDWMVEKLDSIGFLPHDIIIGDFNLRTINWELLHTRKVRHRRYMNLFKSYGFDQFVRQRTHNKNGTLDLVYANEDYTTVNYCNVREDIQLATDHFAIITSIKIKALCKTAGAQSQYKKVVDRQKMDLDGYKKAIGILEDQLNELNFENGTFTESPTQAAIKISEKIIETYNKYVPTKTVKIHQYSTKPRNVIKAEKRLKKIRRNKNATEEQKAAASKRLKNEVEISKGRIVDKLIDDMMRDERYIWKALKDDRKIEERIGPLYNKDGGLVISNKGCSNVINDIYVSITKNVAPIPGLEVTVPEGWTEESLRTIIERNRGTEFLYRRMHGCRNQADVTPNVNPIAFDSSLYCYRDVKFTLGEILDPKDHLNYYKYERIDGETIQNPAMQQIIETLTYFDPARRVVRPLVEAGIAMKIKILTRRLRSQLPTGPLFHDDEEIILPEEYPLWWVTSENFKDKHHHKTYYGYEKITMEDLGLKRNRTLIEGSSKLCKRLRELAGTIPIIKDCCGDQPCGRCQKEHKILVKRLSAGMKLKHLQRREYGLNADYAFLLDYEGDSLFEGSFGTEREFDRPNSWGRPECKRFGNDREVPPPSWWQPCMPAPMKAGHLVNYKVLHNAVKRMNKKSAPGYDGIFSTAITEAGDAIYPALMALFNNCIRKGIMPKVWKLAWVKPLRKPGGDARDPKNTRPISILPTLAKLFETCLGIMEENFTDNWMTTSQYSRRLPRSQSGFKEGSSCSDNLADSLHMINHAVSEGKWVDIILFDFKKAFDSTTFGQIIEGKLEEGYQMLVPVWLSYHQDRQQYVKLGEAESDVKEVLGGCPQGAPRSPTHFSYYIKDLYTPEGQEERTEESSFGPSDSDRNFSNEYFKNTYIEKDGKVLEHLSSKYDRSQRHVKVNFYADDAKAIEVVGETKKYITRNRKRIHVPTFTFGDLQSKIRTMEEVCERKSLVFHPSKCQVLHVGMGNPKRNYSMRDMTDPLRPDIPLQKATLVRDLGIWYKVDGRGFLSTKPTFDKVVSKMKSMSKLAKRALRGLPLEQHTLIWHGLLKTQLAFGFEHFYTGEIYQKNELYKIYANFFSDINIPKNKKDICIPETPVAFLKRLSLSRMHKIIMGKTNLDPEKYFQFTCPNRSSFITLKPASMHCWCCSLSKIFRDERILPKSCRIRLGKLKRHFETGNFEEPAGLRWRCYLLSGGLTQRTANKNRKVRAYLELKKLKDANEEQLRKQLTEIEEAIAEAKPANNIIRRIDNMNDYELIALNQSVKRKTKTIDEKLEYIRSLQKKKLTEDDDYMYL